MTKKAYMKPTMKVVKIQQRACILSGSVDGNNMNTKLQGSEVSSAWSRGDKGWSDEEE